MNLASLGNAPGDIRDQLWDPSTESAPREAPAGPPSAYSQQRTSLPRRYWPVPETRRL